jgi:mRNA interferase RelE/StbE
VTYRVLILRRAQKELGALPKAIFEKLVRSIRELGDTPRPSGCRKLAGRKGGGSAWGIIECFYEIDDAERSVTVLHVGHRRDIYR